MGLGWAAAVLRPKKSSETRAASGPHAHNPLSTFFFSSLSNAFFLLLNAPLVPPFLLC